MKSHIPAAIFFTAMFIMLCSVPFISSCEINTKHQVELDQKKDETEYLDSPMEHNYTIVTIDSCEYIMYRGYHETAITHHGNCKFCKARKL